MNEFEQTKKTDGTKRREIKMKPGFVPIGETPKYTPPARRTQKTHWYKLIGGRYEVVPHSGHEGLWEQTST